jgi:hypothetical protein
MYRPRLAGVVLGFLLLAPWPRTSAAQVPAPKPSVSEANASLLDGIRLYNEFHYAEAVAALDRIIGSLNPADAQQRDLLARAHEYRARSRYVLKDTAGVEADFTALLQLRPDYQPDPGMSPRVRPIFNEVKARTVGVITLQLTPPGEVFVDGRAYDATPGPVTLSLAAGEHAVAAKVADESTQVVSHFLVCKQHREQSIPRGGVSHDTPGGLQRIPCVAHRELQLIRRLLRRTHRAIGFLEDTVELFR